MTFIPKPCRGCTKHCGTIQDWRHPYHGEEYCIEHKMACIYYFENNEECKEAHYLTPPKKEPKYKPTDVSLDNFLEGKE